jgi:Xaa-Pro aminopeptidase
MKHALQDIGLLNDLNDTETYRKYFPHAVSHGLGVDTHDSLGRPRYLEEGMVLTVEPGIYIPEESIGVRIEDDILVTKTGYENLTGQLSTALTL